MFVWKRKYKLLIRGISLMLAFSFLPPAGMREMPSLHAAVAAVVNPIPAKDLESALSPFVSVSDLFIPAGKNASMETFLTDPKQKMVFYLEDAHGNLSAQRNTMQAMQTLSSRGGLKEPWIALEGSGTGEIDHRVLSAFPHQPTRESLTEYLFLQGKLNAADGFVALYNPKVRLFGVDSKDLAEENRQSYRDFLSEKEEAEALLHKLNRVNIFLKGKIYEGNLAWLDKASARFEKDPDYFFTYLNLLQEEAKKNKIPFNNYPHLKELLELKKMESRNQAGDVAREMLERYHTLKVASLWEELDRWTEALWEKLLFYPEAREAHAMDRTIRFYKKLFAFSLLPKEYSRYLENRKAYSPAGLEAKIKQYHFLLKPEGLDFKNPDRKRLEELMQAPLHFYASARKRNGPLLDHLMKLTDQSPQGKVFFIAGGFHRNEIIQDLKAQGLPYAVLTPKISSEEGQENYWRLLGGAQTDLEASLAGLSTVALEDTFAKPAARHAIMILARAFYEAATHADPQVIRAYEQNLAPVDRSILNRIPVTSAGRGISQVEISLPEGLRRFLIQFNPDSQKAAAEIPPGFDLSETASLLDKGRLMVYAEPPSAMPRSEARAAETPSIETNAVSLGDEPNDTAKVRAFLGRLAQSILDKTEEKAPRLLSQEKLQQLLEKLFVLPNDENKPKEGKGEATDEFVRPAQSALTATDFVQRLGDRKVRIVFGETPGLVTLEEKSSSGQEGELVLHMNWPMLVRLGEKRMKMTEKIAKRDMAKINIPAAKIEIERIKIEKIKTAEMFLSYQLYEKVFDKLVHPNDSEEEPLTRAVEMAQSVFFEDEPLDEKVKMPMTPLGQFIGVLLEGKSVQPLWGDLSKRLIEKAQKIAERYVIINELGSGGFSTVYKGIDTELNNRVVAIKHFTKKMKPGTPDLRRVEREISAMGQMNNKNSPFFPSILERIPKPHPRKPGEKEEEFVPPEFLVMEYVQGKPLSQWFPKPGGDPDKKNYLSGREMIEVAIQVLQALQDLHTHERGNGGFIHRDIKPDNIMVYRDDHRGISVKLIDLGLAKELKNFMSTRDLDIEGETPFKEVRQTSANVVLGTGPYMSPEQAMSVRFLSEASDVYSAGLTFIEMLTGVMMMDSPWTKNQKPSESVYERHFDPKYHDLSPFRELLDEELLGILIKMIAFTYKNQPDDEKTVVLDKVQQKVKSADFKLETDRYGNADEPLKALREYLKNHPDPSFMPVDKSPAGIPATTSDFLRESPADDKGTLNPPEPKRPTKKPLDLERETRKPLEPDRETKRPSEMPAKKSWFSVNKIRLLFGGVLVFALVMGGILIAPFFDHPPIPVPPVDKPPDPPVKDKEIKKDKDKTEETPPAPKMKTIEIWNGQPLRAIGVKIYAGLEQVSTSNFYVSKDATGVPFFTDFNKLQALFPQKISVVKESEFKLTVKIYRTHHESSLATIGFSEIRNKGKDLINGIQFDAKGLWRYEQVPVRFDVPPKESLVKWAEFEANLEKNKEQIPDSKDFKDGWTDLTFERFPGKEEVFVSVGGKSTTSFKLRDGTYTMTVRVVSRESAPNRPIETMHFRIGPIKLEIPEEIKKAPTDSKRSELRSAALIMPYNEETVKSFIASPKIDRPKFIFVTSNVEEQRRSEARFGAVAKMYGMAFVRSNVPPELLRPELPEMDNILRRAAAFLRIPSKDLEFLVVGVSSSELIKRPAILKSGKTEFYYMPFERKRFVDELPYRTAFLLILDALRKGELDKFGVAPQGSVILVPESLVNDLQIKLQASRLQASSA